MKKREQCIQSKIRIKKQKQPQDQKAYQNEFLIIKKSYCA